MHFIGMLAVTLPFVVSYDPLLTLSSMLLAILITGCGLLLLHFGERTNLRILAAGTFTGVGIAAMHYTGMAATSANCIVSYNPFGIAASVVISIAASTLAMWLVYSNRSILRTAIGTVVLGLAVSAMHYVAMLNTSFAEAADFVAQPLPALDPQVLAISVTLSAFVICGLFLLLPCRWRKSRRKPTETPAGTGTGKAGSRQGAGPGAEPSGIRDAGGKKPYPL